MLLLFVQKLGTCNLNAINVVFHIGWKIVGLDVVFVQGWVILKTCVGRMGKKSHLVVNNYLEVLVDDESTTLKQLNRLCGSNHDIYSEAIILKRRLLVDIQALKMEEVENRATSFDSLDVMKEENSQFKILTHFIKGKIALSPMETILSQVNWNTWRAL